MVTILVERDAAVFCALLITNSSALLFCKILYHIPLSILSPLWHRPRASAQSGIRLSLERGRWGRGCSHGDLGVSTSTATNWLGLDLEPADRPSPALPQDTWRWMEITSQELGLSFGPLGNQAALGVPVRYLAKEPSLLHTRVLSMAYSRGLLITESPEYPVLPSHRLRSESEASTLNRVWPQSHSRDSGWQGFEQPTVFL